MSDVLIRADHVSKKFSKSLKRSMVYAASDITRNLLRMGSRPDRLRPTEFWAVDDVSMEVRQGESIGLIGPNGSGKTTLMQLLNGIFWPDRGKIAVTGRVGALIAVGAGFHPMLTGRENIYVNAAILGMTKAEVDKQFDAIIDFADIGDFLDTPVKRYSSGMFVRLGFAVAIHCDPDILLVDEVLAVGDKEFQVKCYQKIHEIKKRGTTVVLVAHNEYTIREQTQTCLYLRHGKPLFYGPTDEGVSLYVKDIIERRDANAASDSTGNFMNKKAKIESIRFLDGQGVEVPSINSGSEIKVIIECSLYEPTDNLIIGANFYDNEGFMYCANSYYEEASFGKLSPGRTRFTICIPEFYLPTNKYFCSVVIAEETPDNLLDFHDKAYTFVVGRAPNSRGAIKLPTQWSVESEAKQSN